MPRSMNTAEKKLMLRIETAANLEKASKLQSNRGVDLTGANLNASRVINKNIIKYHKIL